MKNDDKAIVDAMDQEGDDLSLTSATVSSTFDIVDLSIDLKTLQRRKRWYRAEYLRCKRLSSKGYRCKFPVKCWRVEAEEVSSAPAIPLSKENVRKIKNREAAERSRKSLAESIDTAQRSLDFERRLSSFLKAEAFFLQQFQLTSESFTVSGCSTVDSSLRNQILWESEDSVEWGAIFECFDDDSLTSDSCPMSEDAEDSLNFRCQLDSFLSGESWQLLLDSV